MGREVLSSPSSGTRGALLRRSLLMALPKPRCLELAGALRARRVALHPALPTPAACTYTPGGGHPAVPGVRGSMSP